MTPQLPNNISKSTMQQWDHPQQLHGANDAAALQILGAQRVLPGSVRLADESVQRTCKAHADGQRAAILNQIAQTNRSQLRVISHLTQTNSVDKLVQQHRDITTHQRKPKRENLGQQLSWRRLRFKERLHGFLLGHAR